MVRTLFEVMEGPDSPPETLVAAAEEFLRLRATQQSTDPEHMSRVVKTLFDVMEGKDVSPDTRVAAVHALLQARAAHHPPHFDSQYALAAKPTPETSDESH
jgi:hypothetical protein